jgi:uncharacterized protein (DUF2236 family)
VETGGVTFVPGPRAAVSRQFRSIVSGAPDGQPAWIRALEDGTDAGLYGPGSAPWVVHGSLATVVGGIRALLLQALHPAALAGVRQHSRYEQDPLGRLAGTTRWLVTLTFGDSTAVERETTRVRAMHRRVEGVWVPTHAPQDVRRYSAEDPELLRWVHLAFTDSFLATHLVWGGEIPGGADAYVADWARAVEPLGVAGPPRSTAELADQLRSFDDVLEGGPSAREVARFVLNPPLPLHTKPAYAVLAAGAISTLTARQRRLLGLPSAPRAATRFAVSGLLTAMRVALGPRSPSESAARIRLDRLSAAQQALSAP